jgi:hypothetical protein
MHSQQIYTNTLIGILKLPIIATEEPLDAPAIPPSSSSSPARSKDEGIVVWLAYMFTGNVTYIINPDKLDTSVAAVAAAATTTTTASSSSTSSSSSLASTALTTNCKGRCYMYAHVHTHVCIHNKYTHILSSAF